MSTARLRNNILSELRESSILADGGAVQVLVALCQEAGSIEPVRSVLEQLDTATLVGNKLTKQVLGDVIAGNAGTSGEDHLFQVINANQVPRVCYDAIRKAFYVEGGHVSLHADAKAKVLMYQQRLLILRQRLLRMPVFSRPAFGASQAGKLELMDIKALPGSAGHTCFVMGFLGQLAEGQYCLEDLSGSVPVNLEAANRNERTFTENCVVVAEGKLDSEGVFQVQALGMPPPESRDEARTALKGIDAFGGTALQGVALQRARDAEAANPEARVVVLSDCWLDKPATLRKLETIFDGFSYAEPRPAAIVLCGNFQSYDTGASMAALDAVQENFNLLATLLARFQYLKDETRIILVPGPWDAGYMGVLPQGPLLGPVVASVQQKLPSVTVASNPCRIRLFTKEIVIFRDDLQLQMLRQQVLDSAPEDASEDPAHSLFQRTVITLLEQSHLCPLPQYHQPISWQYDHALRLYPAPHCLVLADGQPQEQYVVGDTVCVNPGSLQEDSFAAYVPSKQDAELSSLAADE